MPRTEIFSGVYLTVEDLPGGAAGSGRAMIVEVLWDTPGVRLVNRPFSYPLDPGDPASPQYRLALPDWSLFRDGAAILVNTTEYTPAGILDSIPGKPVRSVETEVVDGKVSHVHEHSYLMYWDKNMTPRLLDTKPPDAKSLADAVIGFGVQGIQIYDGQARYNSIDDKDALISRTFIGFNPTSRTLYLLAFEKASVYTMVQRALDAGVTFGAQFDSGSSTTLADRGRRQGRSAPRRYPQPAPAWTLSRDLCRQAVELIVSGGPPQMRGVFLRRPCFSVNT